MSTSAESTASVNPLWHRLIDDAAVFPPGNAALPDAIERHSVGRNAWYEPCVGPLLLPLPLVAPFVEARADGVPEVALAIRPGAADVIEIAEAVSALEGADHVAVLAVETAVAADKPQADGVADLLNSLRADLKPDIMLWLELRAGDGVKEAMATIRRAHDEGLAVGAKFRMGGTEASAFPTASTVASMLKAATDVGCRLKLTAGLHHLHRFKDAALGCTHHGFGPVLLATWLGLQGADESTLEAQLLTEDEAATVEALATLDEDSVSQLRAVIGSFGCCGVTDPVNELVAAGLLTAP